MKRCLRFCEVGELRGCGIRSGRWAKSEKPLKLLTVGTPLVCGCVGIHEI